MAKLSTYFIDELKHVKEPDFSFTFADESYLSNQPTMGSNLLGSGSMSDVIFFLCIFLNLRNH